jgi:hypothetical protein
MTELHLGVGGRHELSLIVSSFDVVDVGHAGQGAAIPDKLG